MAATKKQTVIGGDEQIAVIEPAEQPTTINEANSTQLEVPDPDRKIRVEVTEGVIEAEEEDGVDRLIDGRGLRLQILHGEEWVTIFEAAPGALTVDGEVL